MSKITYYIAIIKVYIKSRFTRTQSFYENGIEHVNADIILRNNSILLTLNAIDTITSLIFLESIYL